MLKLPRLGRKSQVFSPASSVPNSQLTSKSLDEYRNEMSYNLFLEGVEAKCSFLSHSDFQGEWDQASMLSNEAFTLKIPMTPRFNKRFSDKEMFLDRIPFYPNQGMFVILGKERQLYCYVVSVIVKKKNDILEAEPRQSSLKNHTKKGFSFHNLLVLTLTLKGYSWNEKPLPSTDCTKYIKIMPVSVPTSRAFTAMSRLDKSEHMQLILGKATIHQGPQLVDIIPKSSLIFNQSQKQAIAAAVNNPITVIQGPPGTGKTATIYEIILQFLSRKTYPIMVVAASNLAVDNIAEKFFGNQELEDFVTRVVALGKEADYDKNHRVSSLCLYHQVYKLMSPNIQSLVDKMNNSNLLISESERNSVRSSQMSLSQKFLKKAKVIFTTSVAAGGAQFRNSNNFPVVIMDEATQSSEVISLISLTLPGIKHFVFVGDHKQLNSFSSIPDLSFSLFERVISYGSCESPIMLDTQYRMHPAISEFPGKTFYGGSLKNGITPRDRSHYGILSNPIVFWDTHGRCPEKRICLNSRDKENATYRNCGEVEYIKEVLEHLVNFMHVKRSDIGVITPYSGQRDLLSRSLAKNEKLNPERAEVKVEIDKDESKKYESVTVHIVSGIMVASIDAFQGREKNFIVMSCVRSNERNKIGFLADERRMNVALTRAKYGLVLVGDSDCLKEGSHIWRDYINFLDKRHSLSRRAHFSFL